MKYRLGELKHLISFIAEKVSIYGQVQLKSLDSYYLFQLSKNHCILVHLYAKDKSGVFGPNKEYVFNKVSTVVLYPGLMQALAMDPIIKKHKPPIVHETSFMESSEKPDNRLDFTG